MKIQALLTERAIYVEDDDVDVVALDKFFKKDAGKDFAGNANDLDDRLKKSADLFIDIDDGMGSNEIWDLRDGRFLYVDRHTGRYISEPGTTRKKIQQALFVKG